VALLPRAQRGSTNNDASGGIMNRTQLLARCAAAAAAATMVAGLAAIPAAARPHEGDTIPIRFSDDDRCRLMRIGTQLVKCDNLTGAGVEAPPWVPEL
jgi:hypothetical protein